MLVNISSGRDWMTKRAAEPTVRSPARWREAEEEENRAREGGRAEWGERREEGGGTDKRARERAVGALHLGPYLTSDCAVHPEVLRAPSTQCDPPFLPTPPKPSYPLALHTCSSPDCWGLPSPSHESQP